MEIHTIEKGIRDDLRSNLTDPINRDSQWIHYDSPTEVGQTPAIFIELAPSPRHDEYTGGGLRHFLNYHVHIIVKDKDQGVSASGGSTIITDTGELRNDIVQRVIDRLDAATVAISGAKTVGLTDISGVWNVTPTKKAVTLSYEVEAVE